MIEILVGGVLAAFGLGSLCYARRCLARAIVTLRQAQAEFQKAQAALRQSIDAKRRAMDAERRAQELRDSVCTPTSRSGIRGALS